MSRTTRAILCRNAAIVAVSFVCCLAGLPQQGRLLGDEPPRMNASFVPSSGRVDLREGDSPILSYHYQKVKPTSELLAKVHKNSRKYAQARSNYIHPLYGLDGEVLTADWSTDHPHHRGIYWAWPEVDYRGERGDLHALQRVFARPTGKLSYRGGDRFAEIVAENVWKWDDQTDVVRETATIRAYSETKAGRYVDLQFEFRAIDEEVLLARRGTTKYGGLNIRFAPIQNLKLITHTDPVGAIPRRAWADVVGTPAGGHAPMGITILQNAANPGYPGDWIEFPHLPWLQPTFPAAGTRYTLKPNQPLVLKYRLWIHRGGERTQAAYEQLWQAYHSQ